MINRFLPLCGRRFLFFDDISWHSVKLPFLSIVLKNKASSFRCVPYAGLLEWSQQGYLISFTETSVAVYMRLQGRRRKGTSIGGTENVEKITKDDSSLYPTIYGWGVKYEECDICHS